MSTRSTTHFVSGYEQTPEAIIYRHSDGYPEGHGRDLSLFFQAVEEQTEDRRFTDPSYLAAKLVVWLADRFAQRYEHTANGYEYVKSQPLDFLSVGVVQEDPGDIEYRYVVDCGRLDAAQRPTITCYAVSGGYDGRPINYEQVPIPPDEEENDA